MILKRTTRMKKIPDKELENVPGMHNEHPTTPASKIKREISRPRRFEVFLEVIVWSSEQTLF
jgi:hypothetical protein